MKSAKSKTLVYMNWGLITILFSVVVKYRTDISWTASLVLSLVTGLFGCAISIFMCRWTDRQNISRLNLIIFCGVGLFLTLVIPAAKGGSFDQTGKKMLLFNSAGLVLTSFFLPKVLPQAKTENVTTVAAKK